jgi:DnaJ family protein C protein 28
MGDFDKLVEEKLREAIANGEFDDLPGKGKRQDLRVNPYVHPDDRMAQDMLHGQGFALPWIEERRDLLREREALLRALRTSWERHGGALPTAAQRNRERTRWNSAMAAFRRDADALNTRIRSHNYTVPVPGMRVRLLNADLAIRETGQQHPAAP